MFRAWLVAAVLRSALTLRPGRPTAARAWLAAATKAAPGFVLAAAWPVTSTMPAVAAPTTASARRRTARRGIPGRPVVARSLKSTSQRPPRQGHPELFELEC